MFIIEYFETKVLMMILAKISAIQLTFLLFSSLFFLHNQDHTLHTILFPVFLHLTNEQYEIFPRVIYSSG